MNCILGYSLLLLVLGLFTVFAFLSLERFKSANLIGLSYRELGFSFYSAMLGVWVIYVTPEVGAQNGFIGIFGYAASLCLPFVFVYTLGPVIRQRAGESTYTLTDWVRVRFGPIQQVYVSFISYFYMSIALSSELTSVGQAIHYFAKIPQWQTIFGVFLASFVSCTIMDFRATVFIQQFQGVILLAMIILIGFSFFFAPEIDSRKLNEFWNKPLPPACVSVLTLSIAVSSAELLNMTEWQRVWISKDSKLLKKSLIVASLLVFVSMVMVGLIGGFMPSIFSTYTNSDKSLGFLFMASRMGITGEILLCILSLTMACSTVDSLMLAVLSLCQKITSEKPINILLTVLISLLLFSPALITSIFNFNILTLFLVADLVAATAAPPMFLGIFKLVEPIGVIIGWSSSLLAVFISGLLKSDSRKIADGFREFTLPDGLDSTRSLLLFVCVIMTGSVTTIIASVIAKRFKK